MLQDFNLLNPTKFKATVVSSSLRNRRTRYMYRRPCRITTQQTQKKSIWRTILQIHFQSLLQLLLPQLPKLNPCQLQAQWRPTIPPIFLPILELLLPPQPQKKRMVMAIAPHLSTVRNVRWKPQSRHWNQQEQLGRGQPIIHWAATGPQYMVELAGKTILITGIAIGLFFLLLWALLSRVPWWTSIVYYHYYRLINSSKDNGLWIETTSFQYVFCFSNESSFVKGNFSRIFAGMNGLADSKRSCGINIMKGIVSV